MQLALIPHSESSTRSVDRVRVRFSPDGYRRTKLHYRVFATGALAIPPPGPVERREGLWEATCFELFVRPLSGDAYLEFNFSPSRAWAAYEFQSYRKGRRDLPLAPPTIERWGDVTGYSLEAELDLIVPWAFPCRVGLSAVVEEADGTKSYWALAHPLGKPDFHHPDCFALELPPLV